MKAYAACLLGVSLSCNAAIADTQNEPSLEERTASMMTKTAKDYHLPSLSVAIGIGSDVVFADAIGYADIEEKRAATTKTQYSVGSLAKPMTGLALAKLLDDGKLKLSDPVSRYVQKPAYTARFSVLELASHTAGIPHDTKERDRAEFDQPRDHKNPTDAFHVFESLPLLFEPGTNYQYSSNGYILLSAVIEQAAGASYVDFLRDSLWAPFAMQHTELDTSFAGKRHEAKYYAERLSDGLYTPATTQRDRSFLFGGGGFISTPSDLVNMAQASYREHYLSTEAKQALFTPVKLKNGEVNSEKYSLGWRVGKVQLGDSDRSWTALHHGGVTDKAATAYLLVIPECKASIAFATNYIPDKFWKIRGIMAKTLKAYIQANSCVSNASEPLPAT
ncbi:serine hydrolase domain-containing protein [Pseudoteredinibacter isoporae]|uniref:serine hydrolase domain-containing protein n=1 Tax=Pseudoteredinibacter isoporae TaxID=570281 RepID=UPI003103C96A